MKERPILFSGAMVRAILAGTKTQTRRVVRPQPEWRERNGLTTPGWSWAERAHLGRKLNAWADAMEFGAALAPACPYGVPGDRLWVRETWQYFEAGSDTVLPPGAKRTVWATGYRATEAERVAAALGRVAFAGPWRPSIFMPRAASRITLEVTDVRVQRVQETSLDDARAEGIPQLHQEAVDLGLCAPRTELAPGGPDCRDVWDNRTSVENYAAGWDSINAKRGYSWSTNPWVWAVTFRRLA